MLKAKKPETVEKRLKLFLFGSYKVGKTTAALSFPSVYAIDVEKGAVHEQYVKLMAANGSEILHSNDVDEVIAEVRALAVERHKFRTLLIDPITMIESDLIDKAEAYLRNTTKDYKDGDMRVWNIRDRKLKRLVNLLNRLDMNVIVTAHGKIEYAPGGTMTRIGTTFDGWKRWPFEFDLVIELEERGTERVALVRGTRIETFTKGEVFAWSYEEFLRRYPAIDKEAKPIVMASPEQIIELNRMLEIVKLEEGTTDKWLAKAKADSFEDFTSDQITGCINVLTAMTAKLMAPKEEKKS